MEMTCSDARPLVAAYLDAELSEARASLLRKHLLDCHACRTGAQDGKNLKRWFSAAREQDLALASTVPSGFAARVARRAFSGDVGSDRLGGGALATGGANGGAAIAAPRNRAESGVLRFVLTATALAAGLALLLALAARLRGREVGSSMSADDRVPVPVRQVIEDLERLNAAGTVAPPPAERR